MTSFLHFIVIVNREAGGRSGGGAGDEMEKCRLASFPPNCICCPWKEAAPQEELDTNLSKERASRRHRSGFIVCPSATLLSSPSPLQTTPLHGAVTYRRQNESTGKEDGRRDMCALSSSVSERAADFSSNISGNNGSGRKNP